MGKIRQEKIDYIKQKYGLQILTEEGKKQFVIHNKKELDRSVERLAEMVANRKKLTDDEINEIRKGNLIY